MAAPSSSAIGRANPRPQTPRNATAPMVSGMAMANSRQVTAQLLRPGGRSSFSPQPIRLMMTTSSVSFSVAVSQVRGSGLKASRPLEKIPSPINTQRIASVRGSRFSPTGAHDTSSTMRPRPSRKRM